MTEKEDSWALKLFRLLCSPLVALLLLKSRNLLSDRVLQLAMQLRLVPNFEKQLKMDEEGGQHDG